MPKLGSTLFDSLQGCLCFTWYWLNFYADLLSLPGRLLLLVVGLDGGDEAELDKVLGGNADGGATPDHAGLSSQSVTFKSGRFL